MTQNQFTLVPFEQVSPLTDLAIAGTITRNDNVMKVSYNLIGTLDIISIPGIKKRPDRVNRLWEQTCFELFLKPNDSLGYWEVNLSPSGDWNIYRFTSFRAGMAEDTSFQELSTSHTFHQSMLQIELELPLEQIIPHSQSIKTGISAVIRSENHQSYWALTHPGPNLDFHREDSFILEL